MNRVFSEQLAGAPKLTAEVIAQLKTRTTYFGNPWEEGQVALFAVMIMCREEDKSIERRCVMLSDKEIPLLAGYSCVNNDILPYFIKGRSS